MFESGRPRGEVGGGEGLADFTFPPSPPFLLGSSIRIIATQAGGYLNTGAMETLRKHLRSIKKVSPLLNGSLPHAVLNHFGQLVPLL